MSQYSEATVEIEAALAEVTAALFAVEGYSTWMSSIKKSEVTERDDQGRPIKATLSIDAGVMKDRPTLDYDWSAAPSELSFSLDEADLMTAMTGKYILKAVDEDTTQVTYQLGVEISMPVPRMMIAKTEQNTIDTALAELKAHLEN
jgi:ribosome-associated toxin RatA of RatAB toxin-antitoxin module